MTEHDVILAMGSVLLVVFTAIVTWIFSRRGVVRENECIERRQNDEKYIELIVNSINKGMADLKDEVQNIYGILEKRKNLTRSPEQ